MRITLSLTLLLCASFLACDTAPDTDATDIVVGSWQLQAVTEAVRVTSSTTQVVPDLSATPAARVTATGARSADLDVVVNLTGANGFVEILMTTDESGSPGTGTDLAVVQIPGSAQATLTDFASGEQFFGFFGNGTVISRNGGRFTIPALTLEGSSAVTVGGEITYPEILLAPDRPTEIQPVDLDVEGTLTVTVDDAGTFTARAAGSGGAVVTTGTWERLDQERIRLNSLNANIIDSGIFEVSVSAGALELKIENLDRDEPCDAACIRQVEPEVFANSGSLSAVSFVTTFHFRTAGV